MSCFVTEKPAAVDPQTPTPLPPDTPINKKTYHPRLGLARALSRKAEDLTECSKYYNEVIDLAPEVISNGKNITDEYIFVNTECSVNLLSVSWIQVN